MKSFIRSILGGIAIIVVSTLAGVLHNTVRSHPVRLIPLLQSGASTSSPEEAQLESTSAETDDQLQNELTEPGFISIEQVKSYMDDALTFIIDARSEEAFNKGHIPGAINIPHDRFVDYFNYLNKTVPKEALVICYCVSRTCDFSDHVAEELRILGYENVKIFRDGMEAWEEAGFSLETN